MERRIKNLVTRKDLKPPLSSLARGYWEMDQEKKEKLVQALRKKGVKLPCPRCGSSNFEVVGQSVIPLNDNPSVYSIGGPAVPVGIVACSNCGFITLHALGSLNLMPGS